MDESEFHLEKANVAIIGLGLMGGSLAMALAGKCECILGVDADPSMVELAVDLKIVAGADTDPAAILSKADVIILATPVNGILQLLENLPQYVPQPCIVMDLGSSKRAIMQAMAALPPNLDPVGGHPICGKEKLSLRNADASIFLDAFFVAAALTRTSQRARNCMGQIISAVGSTPLWMDADDHDAVIAATSHMPYLLSAALVLSTPPSSSLIGPGFRSTARLARTPTSMMAPVLQTNRTNILHALETFSHSLQALREALMEADDERLNALLDEVQAHYLELIK
jgi:prephenate dehydrogenase